MSFHAQKFIFCVAGRSFKTLANHLFPTQTSNPTRLMWLVEWSGGVDKDPQSEPYKTLVATNSALAIYETGEVKSLVLRRRSCIENARSSFPGVRDVCEVG